VQKASSTEPEEQSNVKSLNLNKEAIKELNNIAGVNVEELIEILDLDVVQTEEFIGAFSNFDEQRKKLASEFQGDRIAMKKSMQSIKQEHNSKMKQILTDAQFALFTSKTQVSAPNKKTIIR